MKYSTIPLLAILIAGCNESINESSTFDGSSEYTARISRSHIIKDLNEEERNDFNRQYNLYTQPYSINSPLCSGDSCIKRNSLESLHGLSSKEAIRKVSEHEAYILKMKRDADIMELSALHDKWLKGLSAPLESAQTFYVELTEKRHWQGEQWTYWNVKNSTDHRIKYFIVHVEIKNNETGNTIMKKSNVAYSIDLLPGKIETGFLARQGTQRYLNDEKYTVTKYITDVEFHDGIDPMYTTMSRDDSDRYEYLKSKYPSELAKTGIDKSSEPDQEKKESTNNSFDDLMEHFKTCDMQDGIFFDPELKKPDHQFFIDNNLTPYKVEDGFARYKLDASYMGIPVVEMMIPSSTWEIHAITFDLPLKDVRDRLKSAPGFEFKPDAEHGNGTAPALTEDRSDSKRSILLCTGLS